TPTTAHECGSLPVTMDLVAAGLGVAMMPGLAGHTVPAGVSLLPAKGLHRTIEAVVRAGTENQPVIAAALTALKDCA
ncbi:MAG: LysR family transcriptional regulator, partial [Kutzneria sp.]|nr:LysR family transcriptional regulator [Kutzneria sp.]